MCQANTVNFLATLQSEKTGVPTGIFFFFFVIVVVVLELLE